MDDALGRVHEIVMEMGKDERCGIGFRRRSIDGVWEALFCDRHVLASGGLLYEHTTVQDICPLLLKAGGWV